MTDDDGDAKEWVTTKVPKEQKDKARDYKPDDVTFGDCLVAGAERLNDHLDSSPPPGAPDVDAAESLMREHFPDSVNDGPTREEVKRMLDALSTVEQRTGKIERTLEDLQR